MKDDDNMQYAHIFIASTVNQLIHVAEVAYSIEAHSALNYVMHLMLDIDDNQTSYFEMLLSRLQLKHIEFKVYSSQALDEMIAPFRDKLNLKLTKMTFARLVLFTNLIQNASQVIYLDTDVIIYSQLFDELAHMCFDYNTVIAACDDLPIQIFDKKL